MTSRFTKLGTIHFTTKSAAAIWWAEILGQLSDGMWENTMPMDHWHFWHRLSISTTPPSGVPCITLDEGGYVPYNQKVGYNIAGLYPIIGDRMLKIGRMGAALDFLGQEVTKKLANAGEYMPESLSAFMNRDRLKDSYAETYLSEVPDALAVAYYGTTYTMKNLRSDVKIIKQAMKSARNT